ncbi:MAG: hypothetical protein RSB41_01645 [Bacilli bacterium]
MEKNDDLQSNEDVFESDFEMNETKKEFPWKKVFIVLGAILIIILLFLLLRGCVSGSNSSSLENDLLKASKSYYKVHTKELPNVEGECTYVTLETLSKANLISLDKKYKTCDKNETQVKVCKVNDTKYQYTPFLKCGKIVTSFGPWKEGTVKDLIVDKSDVDFRFLGKIISNDVKFYYPNNLNNPKDVNEYYTSSPSAGYDLKDSETNNASKWYTIKTAYNYYKNGEHVQIMPAGYPNKADEQRSTILSPIALTETEYLKKTKDKVVMYAKSGNFEGTKANPTNKAYPYKYVCIDGNILGEIVSSIPCEERKEDKEGKITHTHTLRTVYTCNGETDSTQGKTCEKKDLIWYEASSTNKNKCTYDVNGSYLCMKYDQGYEYTSYTWKWYNTSNYRSYYPNGAQSASGTKTYYISSPAKGAIKDETTKTTAWKWYKIANVVGGKPTTEKPEFVDLTKGYVTKIELISAFKEKGFAIETLKDIKDNELTDYKTKILYRNRTK